MYINRALFKYGYSNFRLEILEYCEQSATILREQYYLDLLKPDYNLFKIAGSSLGHKHSQETKDKISDALKGDKHPRFGKARPVGSGRLSQAIEVTDIKNNTTTTYDSMRDAARALNIKLSRISMYFSRDQQKPYKGIYTFKKVN